MFIANNTTVTIKPGFEPYTNKKKKNVNKKIFFWIRKLKPKDKISYSKSLTKMKY